MDLIAQHRSSLIREKALELGFDDVGFVSAGPLNEENRFLDEWLRSGYQGGMDYMERNAEKRNDPSMLVPGARSVVVVLQNYNPSRKDQPGPGFKISRYAFGRDYHKVLKKRLKKLMSYIQEEVAPDAGGRFFVDSAPVSERSLAARAGLGWIGKNTNLLHPRLGSYVFIGELILDIELTPGSLIREACGGCTRCLEACPTGALVAPYQLDARKCISYLTIENKGDISSDMADHFQGWIFGCDICQEVCPWNWKAPPHHEPDFNLRLELKEMSRDEWFALDEDAFDHLSRGSAIRRTGYKGMMRNLKAAAKSLFG
ncbi:MAG: tRNA epoxyqueuosine(34) reductase QueG, partial [Bacteroidota bacterium]